MNDDRGIVLRGLYAARGPKVTTVDDVRRRCTRSLPTERFDAALSQCVDDGAAQRVEYIVIDAKRCPELLNPDFE